MGRSPRQFWVVSCAAALFVALAVALAVWLGVSQDAAVLAALRPLTALLAAIAVGAIILAIRLALWRRALEGGQTSIVPDQLLADLQGQRQAAESAHASASAAAAATAEAMARAQAQGGLMLEALGVFQSSLSKKDAEIERLRQGGDAQVFRRFLRRFLRVHDVVSDEIDDTVARDENTDALDAVRAILEDALYDCGLEPLEPAIGADYRTAFGVAERPQQQATDDPARHFQIAAVNHIGFQIEGPAGLEAVREASVTIHFHTPIDTSTDTLTTEGTAT